MAAGLGFKTFATGDVLTAADTNGYLMQGVWVFANATARDAAVTSPQEGNTCYLKDTDVIQVYSGTAWVIKSGAASPLTTKGDLYTYSTTDTRLGVGTNGQVLTADSTAATGLKWATAGGSNFSLLNAGGTALTGATTITVSGISNQSQLYIVLAGASSVNASSNIQLRINTDTGNNYYPISTRFVAGSTYAVADQSAANTSYAATDKITLGKMSSNAASQSAGYVLLQGCNSGDLVMSQYAVAFTDGGGNSQETYIGGGIYDGTAAVTSVSLVSSTGNFDNGTLYVYGA